MRNKSLGVRSAEVVWHPCTQMKALEFEPPIPIAAAEGPWLFTEDGRRLFDGISSWWTCLLGHRNPRIAERIQAQLKELDHTMLAGLTHRPAVELAEALVERTHHHLTHVSFASDGASALELALKQSVHAWRNAGYKDKTQFVCLKGSYHGETLGALGVTDLEIFRDSYDPLIHRAISVPCPDRREAMARGVSEEHLVKEALETLEQVLIATQDHIAAVITEPLVQGAGGMVMYPASYLRGLRALADRYRVHWIADEIATGCGRTGRFFAVEHAGVWPEFICLSKGLSGGVLPLSVTLSSESIFELFLSEEPGRAFMHSHSFSGNPLACAAALGALEQLDASLFSENEARGNIIFSALSALEHHIGVTGLRRQGMIFAFEVPDAKAVAKAALDRQLWIRPLGNTVYLMPPYLLDDEQCQWLGKTLVESVKNVKKQ